MFLGGTLKTYYLLGLQPPGGLTPVLATICYKSIEKSLGPPDPHRLLSLG